LQRLHYPGAPPPTGAYLVSVASSTGAILQSTKIGSYAGAAIVDFATSTLYIGTSAPERLLAYAISPTALAPPRLIWTTAIDFTPMSMALNGTGDDGIVLAGSSKRGPAALRADAATHKLLLLPQPPCAPNTMTAIGELSLILGCQGADAALSGSTLRVELSPSATLATHMTILWSRPFSADPTTITAIDSQQLALICGEQRAKGLVEEVSLGSGRVIWHFTNPGGAYEATAIA